MAIAPSDDVATLRRRGPAVGHWVDVCARRRHRARHRRRGADRRAADRDRPRRRRTGDDQIYAIGNYDPFSQGLRASRAASSAIAAASPRSPRPSSSRASTCAPANAWTTRAYGCPRTRRACATAAIADLVAPEDARTTMTGEGVNEQLTDHRALESPAGSFEALVATRAFNVEGTFCRLESAPRPRSLATPRPPRSLRAPPPAPAADARGGRARTGGDRCRQREHHPGGGARRHRRRRTRSRGSCARWPRQRLRSDTAFAFYDNGMGAAAAAPWRRCCWAATS